MALRSTLGLVLALLLSGAGSASAQVQGKKLGPRPIVPPPSASAPSSRIALQELTKQADVIAIGKITEFKSDWNSARTRVFSRAIMTTDEYLKAGQTPPTLGITLQEAGSDAVRFQKSEDVFVFLRKDLDGNLQVIGGTQGKFIISKDVRTAQKMVSPYTTLDEMKVEVTGYLRTGKGK